MQIATLVLGYVQALVWPALIAGSLVGFRRPLVRLLDQARRITVPGVSIERGDIVAQEIRLDTSRKVAIVQSTPVTPTADIHPMPEGFLDIVLARVEKWARTEDAWSTIYRVSDEAANAESSVLPAGGDPTHASPHHRVDLSVLPDELRDTSAKLWQFRIAVGQFTQTITDAGAADYVEAVTEYIHALHDWAARASA